MAVSSPIVLNLDGKGVALSNLAPSHAAFDLDGDGIRDRTGWTGQGDAFLFLDRNGDGTLTDAGEMSFTADKSCAKSDLDGLAAFDSNHDGQLSTSDARFSQFNCGTTRTEMVPSIRAKFFPLDGSVSSRSSSPARPRIRNGRQAMSPC